MPHRPIPPRRVSTCFQKPMYIIVNLTVGVWISFPNKNTHSPAVMSVDYVRV